MTFTATLFVTPRGKQRPRFGKGRTFTPPETVAAEAEIRWLLRKEGAPMFQGAVSLRVVAYFKRPKSCPKWRLHPTVKPDADNLLKTIMDAGNGLLWGDDLQICSAEVQKKYGEPERLEIGVLPFVG